jgi:RES domain-containing protein
VSEQVVWRLCSATYADTAFDGEGAKLFGGRWSPIGLPVVYTAETRALAVLEILAHVDEPERLFELAWVLVSATLPRDAVEKPERFPESWRRFPHAAEAQQFGAEWARAQRSIALRVPSAVVPGEFNYLLNPAHPDFKRVKLGKPEPFSFDPRLGR